MTMFGLKFDRSCTKEVLYVILVVLYHTLCYRIFTVARLEEKESEWKKEYNKLHERYTELFKTHMDYMERSKLFMGGEKIMDSAASPRGR